jgi:hypothetical protein
MRKNTVYLGGGLAAVPEDDPPAALAVADALLLSAILREMLEEGVLTVRFCSFENSLNQGHTLTRKSVDRVKEV